jgi:hypothetical protein
MTNWHESIKIPKSADQTTLDGASLKKLNEIEAHWLRLYIKSVRVQS